MFSMIINALRQIAEFLFHHALIIALTCLFVGVIQYFMGYIPGFNILPTYIRVAFSAMLLVSIWLKIRVHFPGG